MINIIKNILLSFNQIITKIIIKIYYYYYYYYTKYSN